MLVWTVVQYRVLVCNDFLRLNHAYNVLIDSKVDGLEIGHEPLGNG